MDITTDMDYSIQEEAETFRYEIDFWSHQGRFCFLDQKALRLAKQKHKKYLSGSPKSPEIVTNGYNE